MKKSRPHLQYMMRRMGSRMEKIVVPQRQMDDFMKVCTASPDFVEIVPTEGTTFRPGQEILVVSGPFQGVRGLFQRVGGHRTRRLVVSIPGACYASVEVAASDVTPV